MKTFAVLLPVLGLAMLGYAGPTNQVDLQHSGGPVQKRAGEKGGGETLSATNAVPKLFRPEKSYGGALPDLRRKRGQFFKAKPEPGREFQNVSINPKTGQAEGIILFSIKF